MKTRRQERIVELLHEELSNIIQFDLSDPRLEFITVTKVTISPDLQLATVYVSLPTELKEDVLAGLEKATPYIKHQLAQTVKLRYMPTLQFKVDQSLEYTAKIEALLSQIEIPPETDGGLDNTN